MKNLDFPRVIVEKCNSYDSQTILNKFAIANNENEFSELWQSFSEPVYTNDLQILADATKILNTTKN